VKRLSGPSAVADVVDVPASSR